MAVFPNNTLNTNALLDTIPDIFRARRCWCGSFHADISIAYKDPLDPDDQNQFLVSLIGVASYVFYNLAVQLTTWDDNSPQKLTLFIVIIVYIRLHRSPCDLRPPIPDLGYRPCS